MGSHSNIDLDSARIDRIVREVIERHAFSGPNNIHLWRRVERDVGAALRPLLTSGILTWLHVRCDEETNQGSAQDPVVEVVYRTPQRVEQVVIRVGQTG